MFWISRVSLVLLDKLFRCSIFKVLILFEFAALVKQLIHYITSLWVCQVLFQNFFWFFSTCFVLFFWDATFILYHTLFCLSSTFSKFLLIFFLTHISGCMIPFVCLLFTRSLHLLYRFGSLEYLSVHLTFASLVLPFRESALSLYAFRPILSTLFWHFFWICQVCLFGALLFLFALLGLHNFVLSL